MPIRSLSAGNLCGMVGKRYSFKAVSIDPDNCNGQANRYRQTDGYLIHESQRKINELINNGAEDKLITTINDYHKLEERAFLDRAAVKERPWWYSVSKGLRKLRKTELAKKSQVIEKQNVAIQEYKDRLEEIKKITNDVKFTIEENATKSDFNRVKESRPLTDYKGHFTAIDGFKKIAGYETEKGVLNKYFISEIKKEQNNEPSTVPGSVLFFGPTGNGKTVFAKAFAKETGCALIPIRIKVDREDISDKESEALFMQDLKKQAIKAEERFQKTSKRTILFVDEITKVADKESSILSELKDFMMDCSEKYHCTVFCASNYPLKIGLPMEQGNRIFPFIVSLDPPNKDNKAAVMKHYLKERIDSNTDYYALADYMSQKEEERNGIYNISQIKDEICLEGKHKNITADEVKQNIDKTFPNVTIKDLEKYSNEMDELIKNEVDY